MNRCSLLVVAQLACLSGPALAQAPVFFRGDEISREHIIYGSIDTVSDSTVTINLGHAHGVQVADRFAIVRQLGGRGLPLGRSDVIETKPGYSIARFAGHFTPQVGDLALIRAEDLNLWEDGIGRSDRLMLDTINRIESGSDYDTRDTSRQLLDELARDDEALRLSRQPPSAFLTEEEVTPYTIRDASIAGTFRPLVIIGEDGALRAPESRLAYGGSPDLEDALALLAIDLRADRLSMGMPENVELGGMSDLANSQATEIKRRLDLLVRQSRLLIVGDAPAPSETDASEPSAP